MLTDKIIKVFDAEKVKVGSFITYCYTQAGDDGEREKGYNQNGIIAHVSEDSIYILIDVDNKRRVDVKEILSDRVRILGVRDNAI